jgi:hypothetical protein
MTVGTTAGRAPGRYVTAPSPGTLAEVVDLILDKGLVIDVFVRVSLVGIELLTIDARIVVASVDTYLRFAEAVGRLDLDRRRGPGLPDLVEQVGSAGKQQAVGGLARAAGRAVGGALDRGREKLAGGEDEREEEGERQHEHAERERGADGGDQRG